MNEARESLEKIIDDFSVEKFNKFFRIKSQKFVLFEEDYSYYNDDDFKDCLKLGEINFSDDSIIVCTFEVKRELSERSGKKAQYEKAKKILKSNQGVSAGIFIFYDKKGNFRFSLVYPESIGTRRQWSNFRRFTYFVSKEFTNKTFLKQIGDKEFTKIDDLKSAFSVTAVTDIFYNEFIKIYNNIVSTVKEINNITDESIARDYVLLFSIRTIFIGFIQKKKWIGDDDKFLQTFFDEYKYKYLGKDEFYTRWLHPLFFEALNSQQGSKVAYGNNDFSPETEEKLLMAPFLNGGLFKRKDGFDNNRWIIPDKEIDCFFEFIFSHSFTIEENSFEDEDLQLNPEFLGIIFERLVNKANGAVYTPRTEVDLMCRLSLVKWLQKNLETQIKADNLYELFFKEGEREEDQKEGSFSKKEAEEILGKLEGLSICDPAVGSGAFLVGMMHVLDEIEQILKKKYEINNIDIFERKKQIIRNTLYGVEAKEWAVWICQLRLWLSLFVDASDELRKSFDPILPSLDFKIRQGDSLIQRVGSKAFPISGHDINQSSSIKGKITALKKLKAEYFDNKQSALKDWELKQKERTIYIEILEGEIEDKNKKLHNLIYVKVPTQQSFLENDKSEQLAINFNQKRIEELKNEISELKDQLNALKTGNKPLVWNIEFAEVFAEKKGFDIIIGNPPYVRQEDIADPTGKVKDKKEYKKYLMEMVKLDFPNEFPAKTKINAKSDLYVYFYIRGLRLLNSKGIHTFICSNSWLDVGYGVWLQEFLLKKCPVELIIDNHAKRSFEAADVNTIISIIHAPQEKINENHLIKFVAFKKPFEETIYTENLLAIENAQKVESNDIFRVYPITINDIKEAGTEYINEEQKILGGKYVGDKWGGKYLRAPDIFFKILEKGKDKFVKLGDIADVRFGIKTGANEFFYLNEEQAKYFKIENEFLKKIIRSPKECQSLIVKPNDLKFYLFFCNKSKGELKGLNALLYIEMGEKASIEIKSGGNKGEMIIGYQNLQTIKNRKLWYSIGERILPDFTQTQIFNNRFYFTDTGGYFVDNVLNEIHLKTEYKNFKPCIGLSLNSSISTIMIELFGRVGLGEGGLKLQVDDLSRIRILNPNMIKFDKAPIKRKILSIFEECGINPESDVPIEKQEPKPLEDRAELDKIVFDALELTEDERKEVYRSVCRLVWNRISKAKSV